MYLFFFRSASEIVEEVMVDAGDPSLPTDSRPVPSLLVRQVNYLRQKMRPKEPGRKEIDFEFDEKWMPESFHWVDISDVPGARQLVFATKKQLKVLLKAKTWYGDGTFKIVRLPFKQLFTLHAFLKSPSGDIKQCPLLYGLMSRMEAKDYEAFLQAAIALLSGVSPSVPPAVEDFVTDFEAAIWRGLRLVLPECSIHGCCFHWAQAVFRKLKQLGLSEVYKRSASGHNFLKLLFGLPHLPSEHIPAAFKQLKETCETTLPEAMPLMQYIEATWIENSVHPPATWSVFRRVVRTNNDLEGWHRRLNGKARQNNIPLYQLLPLLEKEAQMVDVNMQLVAEDKVCRHQRRAAKEVQERLTKLWCQYEDKDINTREYLIKTCRLTAPTPEA